VVESEVLVNLQNWLPTAEDGNDLEKQWTVSALNGVRRCYEVRQIF
jgi:hypothetical protein